MAIRKGAREYFQLSQDDRILIKKLEILTQAVERVYPTSKYLLWRSFLQGVFAALGSTVGLIIILGFGAFLLMQFKFLPPINSFLKTPVMEKVLPQNK